MKHLIILLIIATTAINLYGQDSARVAEPAPGPDAITDTVPVTDAVKSTDTLKHHQAEGQRPDFWDFEDKNGDGWPDRKPGEKMIKWKHILIAVGVLAIPVAVFFATGGLEYIGYIGFW